MKPTVIISLDFELAWGSFDVQPLDRLRDWARWTHDVGVPSLMDILSRHSLKATWATVGAVMLDGLSSELRSGLEEVRYPHYPRPWLEVVPTSRGESEAPEWFAPSLVERLLSLTPRQDVGFHGFSHVLFDHPGTSRVRAQQEIALCNDIAKDWGIEARSFGFPRNRVAHVDLLRDANFSIYRSVDRISHLVPGITHRGINAVAHDFLGSRPPLVSPLTEDGIVSIPGSLMLRYPHSWRALIPDSSRRRRLRSGLGAAIRDGGLFHVWFHPINLFPGKPRLLSVFEAFAAELEKAVMSDEVRNLTMAELADEVLESGGDSE